MKILDAIMDKFSQNIDELGGAFSDPMDYMAGILDDNEVLALIQDPTDYKAFLANQISRSGASGGGGGSSVGRAKEAKSFYQPASLMPGGGFMNQMPGYLNTDQLILSGLFG